MILVDQSVDGLPTFVQPVQGALLVRTHEPAVADDIGGENGGETALRQYLPSPEDQRTAIKESIY